MKFNIRLTGKLALALAATAGLACAQTATDLESPAVLRVADQLRCSCGCSLTMACKMEGGCHLCRAAKTKIFEMQNAGKSDADIVGSFVQSEGKDVLATRPGPMGVIGPYAALGLGLILVIFVIRRIAAKPQKPALAGVGGGLDTDIDAEVLDRYRERIDKDLEKLD